MEKLSKGEMGPLRFQAGLLRAQDGWEGFLRLRMASQEMALILRTLSHQPDVTARVCAKSLPSCLTLRPCRPQPTRLFCPQDSPGKNTGVGCRASSRGSSRRREGTRTPYVSFTGRRALHTSATWEAPTTHHSPVPLQRLCSRQIHKLRNAGVIFIHTCHPEIVYMIQAAVMVMVRFQEIKCTKALNIHNIKIWCEYYKRKFNQRHSSKKCL